MEKDSRKPLKDDENIKALIVTLANTSASLENGEKMYANLGRTVRRMRVTLWIALIGLVLDLALSLSFAFVLGNQSHLNDQIQSNQDNIKTVSCDLNTLLLGVDTPAKYAAASDKEIYISQFHVLYESRKNLGCQPVINEPVRSP